MEQVLYSSWLELSEGMASAGSLDEVIACHDAYLVSIQRQCLVAPDKLVRIAFFLASSYFKKFLIRCWAYSLDPTIRKIIVIRKYNVENGIC